MIDWKADFKSLSKSIENLTTGIDLPSEIFSLAINYFNLSSGLFLTFEKESGVFTPFASIGIDETSLRRCIIPIDYLESNNLIFTGTLIHTRISKDFLKKHLSKREWDTINTLDIFIFNHHDKHFGILLLFNCEAGENSQFVEFASFFTRKCSELFFNSRSSKISSLPLISSEPPLDISKVSKLLTDKLSNLTSEQSFPVKMIKINYKSIIDFIVDKNSAIDRYRIENDIFKMYNSMLFGSAFILKITGDIILLVFPDGLATDNMVIRNQMKASLISLFDKNSILCEPDITVKDWDFNPVSIEPTAIEDFLTDNI